MVHRDRHTRRHRFHCEVCPFHSRGYDSRFEADDAERRHLINMHGGAEVFDRPVPPPTPDEPPSQLDFDNMSEEDLGAYFGTIFGVGPLV